MLISSLPPFLPPQLLEPPSLSSCCPLGLGVWESTWPLQIPSSSTTPTGTLTMTYRWGREGGREGWQGGGREGGRVGERGGGEGWDPF